MGGLDNKYLIIDTETTGFPMNDWKACSAHIVEIGWMVTDNVGVVLEEYYTLIKPIGFNTQKNWKAFKQHKIRQSEAMMYGKPIKDVLEKFLDVIDRIDVIVGHNIAFDLKIIGNMLKKNGINAVIDKAIRCTYYMSRKKVSVLYEELFGKSFLSHRVRGDIFATKECFFKLKN